MTDQRFAAALLLSLPLAVPPAHADARSDGDLPKPPFSAEQIDPGSSASAWVEPDPLDPVLGPYHAVRDALDRGGVELVTGFTLVYQHASETLDDTDHDAFTGSYDVLAQWDLFADDRLGAGTVGFYAEGGEVFGEDDARDLGASAGSLLGANADLYTEALTVSELWYEHNWRERVIITLGKIDVTNLFDTNAVANDETTQFLAAPLVNNASIAFPDRGLGVTGWWAPADAFYVAGGVAQGAGDARTSGFGDLDGDEVFLVAEGGWTPALDFGDTTCRALVWRNEIDGTEDHGFAISADHAFGDPDGRQVIPFARYGQADGELSGVEAFASAGVGVARPLGDADDLFAVGLVWARPEDDASDDETLLELFYRVQLTPTIAVTPDVQVFLEPGDPAADDVVTVVGLRVQATF